VRLVGVLVEQGRQCVLVEAGQDLPRRLAARRVHAHVQRSRALVAETASRIVDLHRRHAEVGDRHVHGRDALGREHLRQAGERRMTRHEGAGIDAGGAQPRVGARQLERIHIDPDQPAARKNALEDGARVTAAAQRAVDGHVTGYRTQDLEDFRHHDRQVHAGRGLAGRQDLLDVRRVLLGVQFLVLLVELPRIPAGVADPPGVGRRRFGGHVQNSSRAAPLAHPAPRHRGCTRLRAGSRCYFSPR
jgi:hypothetical protein